MKTKITKGKWEIINRGGKIIIAVNADNPIKQDNIVSLYGYGNDEEVKANAELIVNAPETAKQRDELLMFANAVIIGISSESELKAKAEQLIKKYK